MESLDSDNRSSPRFAAGKQNGTPHTSISDLPEVPTEYSTRNRRRSEVQELRSRVELLGTKAAAAGDITALTNILDSIGGSESGLINLRNEVGYNMLHYAVAYGNKGAVSLLLNRGADPDYIAEEAMLESPLLLSIKYARKTKDDSGAILDILLEHKANVNWQNSSGDTALTLATDAQNITIVKQLIAAKGIKVDTKNLNSNTALHVAAARDSIEIASILLEHGASIYAKNKIGRNPIHVACASGNTNLLRVLLGNHSIEITRIVRERDLQGNTPLLLTKTAPVNAHVLVEYLLSLNADIRASDHQGNKILHLNGEIDDLDLCEVIIAKCPQLLHSVNYEQETPLHIAAKLGYKYSVQLFLEKGADLFAKDSHSFTPFMVAVAAEHKEVLRVMLDSKELDGSDRSNSIVVWAVENDYVALLQTIWERDYQLLTEPDTLGTSLSLLHIAAASGAVESTKAMLALPQTRSLLTVADNKKRCPIHIAAENGHLQIVTLLCEADSKVSISDFNGNTPLHLACINGHLQIVKYLLQNGSSSTSRNKGDFDVVACSANEGHDHILQYLLSLGLSPNGTSRACPVILASAKGHNKCVKTLLNHQDIDVSITNVAGYNCLAEAVIHGHNEVAYAILSSKYWKMAMRISTTDGVTPMRLMVEHMPDAAELVLYKCIDLRHKEEHGHTSISEIDYCYEFIEDFQDPREEWYCRLMAHVYHGKALEDGTVATENPHVRCSPSQIPTIRLQSLDNIYAFSNSEATTHDPRKRNNTWGPKQFQKDKHILQLMAKHHRTQLLEHPLVAELLNYKWWIFGYPSFFFQLSIFFLFLAFLTTFALLLPLPNDDNNACLANETRSDMRNDTGMVEEFNVTVFCPGITETRTNSLKALRLILHVLSVIGIIIEVVQLVTKRHKYFLSPHSYAEVTVYTIVLFFIQVEERDCWCNGDLMWQLGAVGCVLAWLNLVYILKRLPFTAIPINMMLNILVTFFSVILLPILLIATFAVPFYMLLSRPDEFTPFRTIGQSCIKTLVMITGEFEFDAVFLNNVNENILYPIPTYILWILFIILMPILFNNLLVGLAVGDIQHERDKAKLTKLRLQVELALSVEELLTILRRFWYKSGDKFHMSKNIPLFLFRAVFNTTMEQKSKNIKTIERNDKLRNHLNGVLDVDPLDEIKSIVEKQESDSTKLKEVVNDMQEKFDNQEKTLQKILSAVEGLSSGPSRFQSKSVKTVRYQLKKIQLDNPDFRSNSIDDGSFPLLPQ